MHSKTDWVKQRHAGLEWTGDTWSGTVVQVAVPGVASRYLQFDKLLHEHLTRKHIGFDMFMLKINLVLEMDP